MTSACEKIIKARVGLILDQPFFGSLALRLEIVEDPTCPTAWTDGERLGYNPAFINKLSLEEIKGLLCHEVMHCACAHHTRRGTRDHLRWNVAGDYAINQILKDCKIILPQGALLNSDYSGMTADEIYNRLPQSQQENSGEDNGSSSDPGGCGEVRDAKGNSTQSEQEWRVAVQQAAQSAKIMGKLPAGIERMIEGILQSRVDWREVLRRFVDQTAKNDYRWFPGNRRYISQGIYLPSLRSEELPSLAVVVDTSGSVGQSELNQFATELTTILEDYRTTCTVIYCDAEIADVEVFTSEDLPLKLHPRGGGGTDFRPPFEWVEKEGLHPSCLIYFTDMMGTFPDDPPGYPVLWVKIGKSTISPPWGEMVQIN